MTTHCTTNQWIFIATNAFPSTSLHSGLVPFSLPGRDCCHTQGVVNSPAAQQPEPHIPGLLWFSKTHSAAESPLSCWHRGGCWAFPAWGVRQLLDKLSWGLRTRSRNPWALLKGWLYCCFTELSAPIQEIFSLQFTCLHGGKPGLLEVRVPAGSWARAAQLPQGCALDTEITDFTDPSSWGASSASDSSETELLLWITEIKHPTSFSAAISSDQTHCNSIKQMLRK